MPMTNGQRPHGWVLLALLTVVLSIMLFAVGGLAGDGRTGGVAAHGQPRAVAPAAEAPAGASPTPTCGPIGTPGPWTATAPLPGPVGLYAFAQVGNDFYVISGASSAL